MNKLRDDLRAAPRYSIADAARLAGTSPQNARRWLLGYSAPGHAMPPVFGGGKRGLVSFFELIELVVVARFRTAGPTQMSLERLREAHAFARERLDIDYPFASERLRSDGGHILHEFALGHPGGGTIAVDMGGNYVLPVEVQDVVARLEYDSFAHLATRWHPYGSEVPLVLDPGVGAGLLTIAGRNLRVDFLVGRWKHGETIQSLSEDFDLEASVVEAALQAAA